MIVNGREMSFEVSITIDDLLNKLNLSKDKVVVELNLEIISKEEYSTRLINHEDKIEIVSFVGGG